MNRILIAFIVLCLTMVVSAGGWISSSSNSIKDVLLYWHSINSFTAHETIKIGNQTFESYVNFTKPDKITRADYIKGSMVQKIIIEKGIQKVVTPTERLSSTPP